MKQLGKSILFGGAVVLAVWLCIWFVAIVITLDLSCILKTTADGWKILRGLSAILFIMASGSYLFTNHD